MASGCALKCALRSLRAAPRHLGGSVHLPWVPRPEPGASPLAPGCLAPNPKSRASQVREQLARMPCPLHSHPCDPPTSPDSHHPSGTLRPLEDLPKPRGQPALLLPSPSVPSLPLHHLVKSKPLSDLAPTCSLSLHLPHLLPALQPGSGPPTDLP